MKYRKKPVVIEAWKISDLLDSAAHKWSELPEAVKAAYEKGDIIFLHNSLNIKILEETMTGKKIDMLIEGVLGELYPCKPDIFDATYEAAE